MSESNQRTEHHIACIVSVTGGLEGPCDCGALRTSKNLLDDALALLREWGTTYDDPRFPKYPPYGERIREFLERVDGAAVETDGKRCQCGHPMSAHTELRSLHCDHCSCDGIDAPYK